jgi:hypothetical protein
LHAGGAERGPYSIDGRRSHGADRNSGSGITDL